MKPRKPIAHPRMRKQFDLLGVDSADRNAKPFSVKGAPGTAIYGGWIVEQEKDSRLTGTAKYREYSDILANVSIVAAGVRLFLNLVAKAGWTVEPADESAEAQRIADEVDRIMNDCATPWSRIVRNAAGYRMYGFAILEWTAKRNEDGTVGYLDIERRPQVTIERWDRDENGVIQGVVQRDPQTFREIYIPIGKTIYVVDDSLNDSPEGLGLFRHLVKDAHALRRYELLEGWGFERDLRGVPVGRAPLAELRKKLKNGTLTQSDVDALLDPMKSFVQKALRGENTGLLLDSQVYRAGGDTQSPSTTNVWDLELLSADGQMGLEEIAAAITRLTRNLARALGVEQLLLGEDSVGSHALSKDKTQTFGLIVDSTLTELREAFEKDFLGPLFALNGWNEALKPSFAIEQVQFRDLEQIAGFVRDIAQAGAPLMTGDKAVEKLYEIAGLPAPDPMLGMQLLPGEEMPEGPQPAAPGTNSDSEEAREEQAMETEDEGEEA